ncbi:MAG: thioredoxin family protein [Bacteroidetes bacterium QS_9_68_14]|nr:MAG: thioredoxin family protein [Bacteroidetes bacterium QS_9_68_14]
MRTSHRFVLGLLAALALLATAPGAAAQDAASSLPSAADQDLPNATGAAASISSLAGANATAVIFWSNQCPWTAKYEGRVMDLAQKYDGQGVQIILVNSNSASNFPKESLAASRDQAGNLPVPYLKDEGGQVAEVFGASRTPHVFVYDRQGQLAYTGAIDDSPGDPSAVEKPYLGNALQALAGGDTPPTAKTKAFGCTLKD